MPKAFMVVTQYIYTRQEGWHHVGAPVGEVNFLLVFGGVDLLASSGTFDLIREKFPNVPVIQVSTAGEIAGSHMLEESLVCTAVTMRQTKVQIVYEDTSRFNDSFECGENIAASLSNTPLTHVLVLAEGTTTNGDKLVQGLRKKLGDGVLITGGLAADSGRFLRTLVGFNEPARPDRIVAIGFSGNHLRVAHGTQGGWDPFGPTREITRSDGNVLFELDGKNALELYKKYLGERAAELPGAALLFPLCVFSEGNSVVRTILGIDEKSGSMTFAGDVPQGAKAQFMMSNFDRLIDGASRAATDNLARLGEQVPELVLMVSCVGRKIVLGPRTEEEIESVTTVFGNDPVYCGFYSNGEISPLQDGVGCSLHNQTMTITTYRELP